MTVYQWLSDWISLRSPGLAPRTVESYRALVARHIAPAFGSAALENLSPAAIQSLLAALCDAGHARTAQLVLVLLRAALSDALDLGVIAADPTRRVLRPRHVRADPRYWSPDEMRAFALHCNGAPWGHAWLLAMLCGLRRGELAGLRWSDVDFAANVLHIRNQRLRLAGSGVVDAAPKSAAGRRDVPLPGKLVALLRSEFRRQRLRQAAGAVLPAYVVSEVDNRPIDPHRLNLALSHDITAAGLRPINLHGLRHSMATAAVAAGVSIKILQSLLGHASYTTTADIYAHVLHSEKIDAIDILSRCIYNASVT